MKPLNIKSIRRRSLQFWALFALLLAFTLVPASSFIWTVSRHISAITDRDDKLRSDQIRRAQVDARFKDLYIKIINIRTNNEHAYQTQLAEILGMKSHIETLIGADSAGLLMSYARINTIVEPLTELIYQNAKKQKRLDNDRELRDREDAIRKEIERRQQSNQY